MKKLLIHLVLVSACVLGGCSDQRAKELRIGADLTLSGNIAYWGVQIQKGLLQAAYDFNQTSDGIKVNIVCQDNKGSPAGAVSVFRRLVSLDDVSAVVSVFSPVSNPLREVAGSLKTPLIATVVSAEGFGKINDWCFRDFPSQSQQSITLANYVVKKYGVKHVASIVVNDDYGKDGEIAFCREIEKLGGTVEAKEYMSQNDTTIVNQLNKLLSKNPDCIYIVVRDTALGTSVKQMRERGYKGLIVGVNAFDSPLVWSAAGAAGEGCIFTSAYVDLSAPKAQKFVDAYKNTNGEAPDWIAAYGYSIGQYLVASVANANGDKEVLRSLLASVRVDSIRGELVMNPSRDVISPIGIFVREGDNNKLIEIR